MKIRKLHLKNIGVFDDETIEFKPCPSKGKAEIHILTGQNGSGKSTILMALAAAFLPGLELVYNPTETNPPSYISNYYPDLSKRFRFDTKEKFVKVYADTLEGEFGFTEKERDIYSDADVTLIGYSSGDLESDGLGSLVSNFEIAEYKIALSQKVAPPVKFGIFAYSGYRFIKSEKIELLKENKDNPLVGSLDFTKTYKTFTINQWLANNLSQRALAREEGNNKKAEEFDNNIDTFADFISEIVGYEVDFKLRYSPTQLVIKIKNKELDFDTLPDGLRSLISWVGDLLMRTHSLEWRDELPVFDKNLILLLDEIEIHLHPAWQRKVLPVIQKCFKNSQIFISTHSPFVVNSIDNAWIYELKQNQTGVIIAEKSLSKTAYSYQTVLREIFDIEEKFGVKTQENLEKFLQTSRAILNSNGEIGKLKRVLLDSAKNLASEGAELQSIVFIELARLSKETGERYEI